MRYEPNFLPYCIKFLLTSAFIQLSLLTSAQDSLIFDNGNIVVGEIKEMNRGVLEVDASFGDENFKIKWLKVRELYSNTTFLVSVRKKTFMGKISSIAKDSVKIDSEDEVFLEAPIADIIYIRPVKLSFSDRIYASIELGFNMVESQNLRQFSNRNSLGYRANKWITDLSYNSLRSFQDNSASIERHDGQFNFRYLLARNWYLISSVNVLSNNEQNLKLRMNSQLGLGKFLYSSNRSSWSIKIGGNNNNESFTSGEDERNSWEAYFGTVLNLYDVGDINVVVEYIGYSGLDNFQRYRSDSNIDVKYELPFDLFIRAGFSINYDNQPALGGSETSYIIRTGLGWEW